MNTIWDNIFKRRKKDEDVRSILHSNMLFQDLTQRELTLIESIVHVRRYHAGEPIFRQGELGVGMFIVVKGRIEIFVNDPNNVGKESQEIYITQLIQGDFFGELSLVEENGRRTASAVARDESMLIGFFRPDLMQILSRSPSTGIKIVVRLAEVLGTRLKETTEKVSDLRQALKELREPPPTSGANKGNETATSRRTYP